MTKRQAASSQRARQIFKPYSNHDVAKRGGNLKRPSTPKKKWSKSSKEGLRIFLTKRRLLSRSAFATHRVSHLKRNNSSCITIVHLIADLFQHWNKSFVQMRGAQTTCHQGQHRKVWTIIKPQGCVDNFRVFKEQHLLVFLSFFRKLLEEGVEELKKDQAEKTAVIEALQIAVSHWIGDCRKGTLKSSWKGRKIRDTR